MGLKIQCPDEWEPQPGIREPAIFLAGGISNCPNWQEPISARLENDTNLTIINPRRDSWDMNAGPEMSKEQIRWEHRHLQRCDWVLFWFPCETLCPITLLELGKMLISNKRLFIGMHPEYQRRLDVIEQTVLERPLTNFFFSLNDLEDQVIRDAKQGI